MKFRKAFSIVGVVMIIMLMANSAVFAAKSSQLNPGDSGYVGALNDRPSNAFTPNTKNSSNTTTVSPMVAGYWWQYEPSTIAVLVRPNNDPSSSGTVTTYHFGYYLRNVLPNEWVGSWPANSLDAGAIAVRSYGWYCVNYPKYPTVGAAVDNTTNSQVFKPNTMLSSTDNAFVNTDGLAIGYNNAQQPGFYKAGTYGSSRDSSSYSFYNNMYQNGTDYWANNGESYSWMTSYYYPGTNLVSGSGDYLYN